MPRYLSAAAVSMLAFGWWTAGPATAAVKINVCHREGNGTVHLINVASQAVPAHLNHGDALPGDLVPGVPGVKFDDFCQLVPASTCPCDFTLGHLVDLGIQPATAFCVGASSAQAVAIHVTTTSGQHVLLRAADVTDNSGRIPLGPNCSIQSSTVLFERFPVTANEFLDCRADLVAMAAVLETTCSP
jgi:hypothetical protein